ncbi:MAG: hypothetical protein H3C27_04720 [Opitutaceae bacterium]|nr:hypothetical protein [Opitutaceae bacterium]
MNYLHLPARLAPLLAFADVLDAAARESTKALTKVYREATRTSRGGTLRPGADTPLWNELAKLAAGHLETYGDKANLARILGVPRQRVHEYLVAKTACPDTERALMLLAWVLTAEKRKTSPTQARIKRPRRRAATATKTAAPTTPVATTPSDSASASSSPPSMDKSDPKSVTYYVTLIPPALD